MPAETRRELERLAGRYGLVACVTGRTERRRARDRRRRRAAVRRAARPRARAGRPPPGPSAIHAFARDRPGPGQELKPLTAAFHFRRAADARRRASQLEDVAAGALAAGFRTRWGRMVLEVLPPVDATKGTAVRHLLDRAGLRARALRRRRHDRPRRLRARSTGSRLRCGRGRLERRAAELGEHADLVVGSTAAFLELLRGALEHRAARAARAPGGARRRARSRSRRRAAGGQPVRRRPAHPDDLRKVHEIRAVDAREAGSPAAARLELSERRRAEIRAVVGVHAAVVAVGLDEVHLVEVEQLGAAARRRPGPSRPARPPRWSAPAAARRPGRAGRGRPA